MAGMALHYPAQPGEGAGDDLVGGLAAGAARVVPGRAPQLRPARGDLVARPALPFSLVDLPPGGVDDDFQSVSLGHGPRGVQGPSEIAAIDRAQGQPREPLGGGMLWAAGGDGRVVRIDPVTNEAGDPLEVGERLGDIAVSRGAAWVAAPDEDLVYRLQP